MAPQAAARPAVNAQTVQRLKVLFITNWYPSAAQPGTALWVREHAKAAGIFNDVAVLHCAGPQPELDAPWSIQRESELRREEGIPTYRLSYRPPLLGRLRYAVYVCTMLRGIAHVSGAGFSPDVLHVHVYDAGVPAVIFGRLRRIPVAVSEHFSSFPARRLGRLDLLKARLAMRWADAVLPVSAFLQKALEDYGIEARYHLVPNVVDTELFHPPLQPAREGAGRRLLFVGQLVPVKDLANLMAALGRLRRKRADWRLDIVGEGQGRAEYERLAAQFGLDDVVTFHGSRSRPEVAEFMRSADLFVLPSRVETFSVPAAEALASGIPVLATRCGGPQEFITPESGLLVTPGDVDALYQGLDYMLDNLHLYPSMRIAQHAMERFAPHIVGAELDSVYRSIIGRRPPRPWRA